MFSDSQTHTKIQSSGAQRGHRKLATLGPLYAGNLEIQRRPLRGGLFAASQVHQIDQGQLLALLAGSLRSKEALRYRFLPRGYSLLVLHNSLHNSEEKKRHLRKS